MYISKSSCLLMLFYINKDEMHTAFYVREAQKKQREETVEVHQGYQRFSKNKNPRVSSKTQ